MCIREVSTSRSMGHGIGIGRDWGLGIRCQVSGVRFQAGIKGSVMKMLGIFQWPSPRPEHLKPNPQSLILQRGYTLVELMLVVSIAGILVTLAEPSFRTTMLKAREAALKQDLFTLREVLDQYRADRGKYPNALGELTATGYIRHIPVDPFTKSNNTWQAILDQNQGGVFDVHSGSDLVALDGTAYNSW